jgi:hypothetical protein
VRIFGLLLCKEELEYLEQKAADVTIKAFYKNGNQVAAKKLVDVSADAIEYFKNLMGFYPQHSYSFLPYSSIWGGGGNWSTGIAFFHSMDKFNDIEENEKPWIAAHEICHHYWGEYIPDSDYCGWLWIGLGMIMDEEYSINHGLKSANVGRATQVIKYHQRGNDTTIWLPIEQFETAEKNNSNYNSMIRHNKSFSILYMLKEIIGKDLLFDVMRHILHEYAGCALRTIDFWRICEEKSGMRLDWFFNDCLYSNHIAGYEIESIEKDGGNTKTIINSFGDFKVPAYIEAHNKDGVIIRKVLNRLMSKQTICFDEELDDKIFINTIDGRILVQTEKVALNPLLIEMEKLGYEDDGKSLERYSLLESNPIDEMAVLFKLASQLFTGKHYNEAEHISKHIYSKKDGVWYWVSCIWLGLICDITNKREQAIDYYKELLSVIPDNFKANFSQLKLDIDKYWLEQRLNTPYNDAN